MAQAGPVKHKFELKKGERIKKILVDHDKVVHGIGFEITDEAGKLRYEWIKGTNVKSAYHDEVPLDDDFLTHISGTYGTHIQAGGTHKEETCIISMRIHTNLHPGGLKLYGEEKEPSEVTPFSSPLPFEGSLVGFVGWTENFLGNIGFYTSGNVVKQSGLYGDDNVDDINWYIKLKEGDWFSKLTINHGNVVDGIRFKVDNLHDTYSLDFTGSEKNPAPIPLTKEDEVITKITGYYGKYKHEGTEIVTTQIAEITIYTKSNLKGYGPYGDRNEVDDKKDFSYEVPKNHSLVGFYGSYRLFLNSIGFIEKFTKDTTYGPYGRKIKE